jgi:hypothetical protein
LKVGEPLGERIFEGDQDAVCLSDRHEPGAAGEPAASNVALDQRPILPLVGSKADARWAIADLVCKPLDGQWPVGVAAVTVADEAGRSALPANAIGLGHAPGPRDIE